MKILYIFFHITNYQGFENNQVNLIFFPSGHEFKLKFEILCNFNL
jgi:hypothetical protein